MPLYLFVAQKPTGQIVSGRVEAATLDKASEIMRGYGMKILELNEEKHAFIWSDISYMRGVRTKDLVVFVRQLATLNSASIPLVRALNSLVPQTANVQLSEIIKELAIDVESGASFSLALQKHAQIFDEFFVTLVRSGETSGRLEEVLNYLADQLERDYDLMSRIKGMMLYPAFIIIALIVVSILTIMYVLPNLVSVITETAVELPLSTRLLISISSFFLNFWWLVLILCVGVIAGGVVASRTSEGKYMLDKWKLRTPILGLILEKMYIVRFTQGLETLLRGKVNLVAALKIISSVTNNMVYHNAIISAVRNVEDGNRLSFALEQTRVFPGLVYNMVDVGEESGRLDEILGKIGKFYKRELDVIVNNLVSLLEPVIIVVLGLGVAFILMAIILPIYNLSSQL